MYFCIVIGTWTWFANKCFIQRRTLHTLVYILLNGLHECFSKLHIPSLLTRLSNTPLLPLQLKKVCVSCCQFSPKLFLKIGYFSKVAYFLKIGYSLKIADFLKIIYFKCYFQDIYFQEIAYFWEKAYFQVLRQQVRLRETVK